MTPKKLSPEDISNNANLHTSIQIGDDKMNKEDYQSVYDSNFGNKNLMDGNYYINNNDKKMADDIFADDDWMQFLTTRFKNALNITLSRVAWNYKTAIPVYYVEKHQLSLLLPLALEKKDVIDVALVVEHKVNKEKKINNYVGRTIFTLQMAYSNARLITRPDSDWLMADMNPGK